MRVPLLSLADRLRSSFWFIPGLIAAVAAVAALLLIAADYAFSPSRIDGFRWLNAGDANTARTLLSAILAAIITTLTVVFSMTMVVLTLASSQFGPRMLRNFMQDRGTQVVLGVFVGTALYCVVVLGAVGRMEEDADVPHASTFGALLLSLSSLGVLVYFIHHLARSIQAEQVIASVARDIDTAIDRWYVEDPDEASLDPPSAPPVPDAPARQVTAGRSDYVQAVDHDKLVAFAVRHDLLIRLRARAGDFVVSGEVLADVWPESVPADEVERAVRGSFIFGTVRTPTQDVEFAIDQLVEIAVRAISPAVNDPFTALACIDRLTAALARLCRCRLDRPAARDERGTIRLIRRETQFAGVVAAAMDKIRQYGRGDAGVVIHLLEAIRLVAHHAARDDQRAALRRQAEMIRRGAVEALPEAEDIRDAEERYLAAVAVLDRPDQHRPERTRDQPEPAGLRA